MASAAAESPAQGAEHDRSNSASVRPLSDIKSTNAPVPQSDEPGDTNAGDATNELTMAVDQLLEEMQRKFAAVSDEMLNKMDEMTRRLDNLEASMRSGQQQDTSASAPVTGGAKQA